MRRQRPKRPERSGRGPRRSPASDRISKGRIIGVCLGVLGVTIVGGVLAATLYVKSTTVSLDPETGCPKNAPPSEVTAVIIDGSDILTPVQVASIRNEISSYRNEVAKHGALELYAVGRTEDAVLRPLFLACNPGDPKELSELTSSIRLATRKWQEGFIKPLDDALTEAIPSTEQSTSPIMETIQSVAVTAFGPPERKGIPRRLIIVSDMMQNTSAFSHYRGGGYEQFKKAAAKKMMVDLRDVVVEILYVRRESVTKWQGGEHIKFWDQYFIENGTNINRAYSITG